MFKTFLSGNTMSAKAKKQSGTLKHPFQPAPVLVVLCFSSCASTRPVILFIFVLIKFILNKHVLVVIAGYWIPCGHRAQHSRFSSSSPRTLACCSHHVPCAGTSVHSQSAALSFDDDDAAATAAAPANHTALPSTPTSSRPRVRAVASTPLQAAPTAKRVRVQAPTVSTIKTYEAFNKKGEKCPPPVHLKTTAAPKGKYTLNLCNECNTECKDVARGKWVCMNNHTSDVESTPEETHPYFMGTCASHVLR